MYCPRLDHFVRFNPDGSVSRCGHMVSPPRFRSLEDMESSSWLADMREQMLAGQWPVECKRCQETDPDSIRRYAEQLDSHTPRSDYLQVGGVLDNICNAACMTCNENLSTRIGSLKYASFPIVKNIDRFRELPKERIVHLDINGGEPSYSKDYRRLLDDLPPNLQTLRLNTNCSTVLTQLEDIARRGIKVTVTVSCDGIEAVHDLVRWPITWSQWYENLLAYKRMPVVLNLWPTVSRLNQHDLPNIQKFARDHDIDHAWAYLSEPWQLSVHNTDNQAAQEYIDQQRQLRGI